MSSALHQLEQARAKVVFMAVGLPGSSLELILDYAKNRTQFCKPIASFQLVQEMLSQMATQIEAARFLGYRAVSGRSVLGGLSGKRRGHFVPPYRDVRYDSSLPDPRMVAP